MIIAIDAASTDLSLALAEPDGAIVATDAWTSAQRQSAELMPRLMDLLGRSGRELRDASLLAVGTGPGSFTGLRVAMALAKGLAVALGRPLVGVASLAAWLDEAPDARAAIARAGAHEAYVLEPGTDPIVVPEALIVERLGAVQVVAPAELAAAFGLARASPPRGAPAIARRAARRIEAEPGGDDVRTLEPTYLRAPRGVEATSEARVRWL
ncbi:MAG TPA: tRNA (adenosine(37)-N6)-threonylcarbamoyltransferase complex dimerization subunit type 1 TsaB [Candidatus Limnocylindria bacterium]